MNIESISTDRLCRLYVCHSCLYYEHDMSVISDHEFDKICKILLARWKEIEYNKQMKEYWIDKIGINKNSLKAGSGYELNFKSLPLRMQMVVETLKSGIDITGQPIKIADWLK